MGGLSSAVQERGPLDLPETNAQLDSGVDSRVYDAFVDTQFTIGKLARAAHVKVDTVRYYERIGLLPAPVRSESGYRLYGPPELRQLRFIRGAQALGFSLDEIGALLEVVNTDGDRAHVRSLAVARLTDLDRELAVLLARRDRLQALVQACAGHGSVAECPIIDAVVSPDGDLHEQSG